MLKQMKVKPKGLNYSFQSFHFSYIHVIVIVIVIPHSNNHFCFNKEDKAYDP